MKQKVDPDVAKRIFLRGKIVSLAAFMGTSPSWRYLAFFFYFFLPAIWHFFASLRIHFFLFFPRP